MFARGAQFPRVFKLHDRRLTFENGMRLNIDRLISGENDLQHAAIILFQDGPPNLDLSSRDARGVKSNPHNVSAGFPKTRLQDALLVAGLYHERAKYIVGPDRLAPSIPECDLRSGDVAFQALAVILNREARSLLRSYDRRLSGMHEVSELRLLTRCLKEVHRKENSDDACDRPRNADRRLAKEAEQRGALIDAVIVVHPSYPCRLTLELSSAVNGLKYPPKELYSLKLDLLKSLRF